MQRVTYTISLLWTLPVESIESIENLESVDSVERLDSVENLQSVDSVERLDSVEVPDSKRCCFSVEELHPGNITLMLTFQ